MASACTGSFSVSDIHHELGKAEPGLVLKGSELRPSTTINEFYEIQQDFLSLMKIVSTEVRTEHRIYLSASPTDVYLKMFEL